MDPKNLPIIPSDRGDDLHNLEIADNRHSSSNIGIYGRPQWLFGVYAYFWYTEYIAFEPLFLPPICNP